MNYEQMWEIVKNNVVEDIFKTMKEQISKGKSIPCIYLVLYPSGRTSSIFIDEILEKKVFKDKGLTKPVLMKLIRMYLKDTQPDFVIFMSEGFTLPIEAKGLSDKEREEVENDLMEKYGEIKNVPGRGEILICSATTKYGVHSMKTAQVVRDRDEITFQHIDDIADWGGRMIMERWARD